MRSRALPFVRALALLSAPAAGACGDGEQVDPAPAFDAGFDGGLDAVPDASPDAVDAAVDADGREAGTGMGTCVSVVVPTIECVGGNSCYIDETAGAVRCGPAASTLVHPCGAITCGWDCACGDAELSQCSCFVGIGGPLAAPGASTPSYAPHASSRGRLTRAGRPSRSRRAADGEPLVPANAEGAAAITRARARWEAQLRAEHRSAPLFDALGEALRELHGEGQWSRRAAAMADDERAHARECARVARLLGGKPRLPPRAPARVLGRHPGVDLAQSTLRHVVYMTCLSELLAVAQLTESLQAMRAPALRTATRGILRDEVTHARFGFDYLAAFPPTAAQASSLSLYLRHAFAVLEDDLTRGAPPPHALSEAERALGLVTSQRRRTLLRLTVEEAIVPALERHGIAGRQAWKLRNQSA